MVLQEIRGRDIEMLKRPHKSTSLAASRIQANIFSLKILFLRSGSIELSELVISIAYRKIEECPSDLRVCQNLSFSGGRKGQLSASAVGCNCVTRA